MRIWDFPPAKLCNKHLVAQHHEIHCIYNIITKNLKGFARHPEVMRWRANLKALVRKHEAVRYHLENRGMGHFSPLLEISQFEDICADYPNPWQSEEKQLEILKAKGCGCYENITGEQSEKTDS